MKRVMSVMFLPIILSILGINHGGICYAEDDYPEKISNPDVAPIYDSYYDSSTNQLCIYGAAVSTVINVRVTYRGNEVLNDEVSPEQLPAWYDFSDYDGGTYLVVISAGDTVLCTFSFSKA